ncbi:MAG: DEAD/DEAH box helicase, partial [Bacteroidia bacterium]
MDYFTKNFNKINYKPQEKHEDTGLRNAQLGAIHAIASHFTLHHQKPSIISLPTGTGKTGVITLAPFVLRRKRVLIITYMKLVRNQIAENFIELQDLKKLEVLPLATKPPKVKELTNILSEDKEFKELENYDVVVSLAVNILKIKNFNYLDLFDCVIFDEAHHSATSSWTDLMNYFPQAHKLLFTATPYRRDDKEIQGKIVYHYPIQKAFEDGVFGEIKYEQVHGENVKNKDFEIAKRTDEIFRRDALLKYNHVVLVRVKDKGRAKEIKKIYDKTSLKLEIINSDYSSKQIQTVLNKLTKCEIDGVITVNMLGEGFNYPRFKIAAIHDTHKSVAVALQFIGRFARTNAIERIGAATFIAFEDKEFKLEKEHLYSESAKWQEIINNVNESIIDKQIKTHRHIESYNSISGNENIEDLPLYSLRPKSHVKVYKCSQVPDLDAEIILPNEQQEFSYISPVNNVRILVTSITFSPKWIKSNVINNKEYNLYILYFNEANNYLLIHSSNVKSEFLYQTICEQVLLPDQFRKVPSYQIERVLLDVKDFDIFNLGLKNIQQKEPGMSYQTKNGRNPIRDVSDGEVNNSSPGHAFGRGKSINPDGSEGSNLTIGFSAGSKVWSSHNSRLDQFVDWCDIIIKKIVSTRDIDVNPVYNSFARASIIEKFPSNIFHLQWNVENDFNLYLAKLSYSDSNSAFA